MKKFKPQEPVRPFPYIEKEVSFTNFSDGTILNGTLTIPCDTKKHPALVLVTGSGAQNRNEELLGHKPFLVISDYLTKAGIAVLRYDDRHFKMSAKKGGQYTTKDLAGDAMAAFNFLYQQTNIYSSCIGIAGHSEGGIIAAIVASEDSRVGFIISLAGTGISGQAVSTNQSKAFSNRTRDNEFSRIIQEILIHEPDTKARKHRIWQVYNSQYGFFNLWAKFKIWLSMDVLVSNWNCFFLSYNPAEAWEKVKCPVLALNGEFDLQVSPAENLSAIEKSLIKAGNCNYKIKVIPSANHLFQVVENGVTKTYLQLVNEYKNSEQTISPDVLKLMADWIMESYSKSLNVD